MRPTLLLSATLLAFCSSANALDIDRRQILDGVLDPILGGAKSAPPSRAPSQTNANPPPASSPSNSNPLPLPLPLPNPLPQVTSILSDVPTLLPDVTSVLNSLPQGQPTSVPTTVISSSPPTSLPPSSSIISTTPSQTLFSVSQTAPSPTLVKAVNQQTPAPSSKQTPLSSSQQAQKKDEPALGKGAIIVLSTAGAAIFVAGIGIYTFRKVGLKKSNNFKERLRKRLTFANGTVASGRSASPYAGSARGGDTLERLTNVSQATHTTARSDIGGQQQYAYYPAQPMPAYANDGYAQSAYGDGYGTAYSAQAGYSGQAYGGPQGGQYGNQGGQYPPY